MFVNRLFRIASIRCLQIQSMCRTENKIQCADSSRSVHSDEESAVELRHFPDDAVIDRINLSAEIRRFHRALKRERAETVGAEIHIFLLRGVRGKRKFEFADVALHIHSLRLVRVVDRGKFGGVFSVQKHMIVHRERRFNRSGGRIRSRLGTDFKLDRIHPDH